MILGRVPIRDVKSLDEVEVLLTSCGGARVLIFDVDNTLAPQGTPLEEFRVLVRVALDRFEANPAIDRVVALSNGPPRGVERMISRGNKPWTTRRRLGIRASDIPIVVVGDQILTDGVLAWRLRASFFHLVIDGENEEPRQARMRRWGGAVEGVLFRRGGDPTS